MRGGDLPARALPARAYPENAHLAWGPLAVTLVTEPATLEIACIQGTLNIISSKGRLDIEST